MSSTTLINKRQGFALILGLTLLAFGSYATRNLGISIYLSACILIIGVSIVIDIIWDLVSKKWRLKYYEKSKEELDKEGIAKIKDAAEELIVDQPQLRRDFSIEENVIDVDLVDSNGEFAIVKHFMRVRCIENGRDRFEFRYSPSEKLKNFTLKSSDREDSTRLVVGERLGGKEVKVLFDPKLNKDDLVNLELSFECHGAFTSANEFWLHRRYYTGATRLVLRVIFPKDRLPTGVLAKKIHNGDVSNGSFLVKQPTHDLVNGRHAVVLDTDEVPNTLNILLEWDW